MSNVQNHGGAAPSWSLGDRLSKARRQAKIDQKELARRFGLSHGVISKYETDKSVPKLVVLEAWANRCQVPLEWLIGDEEIVSDRPEPEPAKSVTVAATRRGRTRTKPVIELYPKRTGFRLLKAA